MAGEPSSTVPIVLEERGVIRGYAAKVDATQLGKDITAFVGVGIATPPTATIVLRPSIAASRAISTACRGRSVVATSSSIFINVALE